MRRPCSCSAGPPPGGGGGLGRGLRGRGTRGGRPPRRTQPAGQGTSREDLCNNNI